MAGKNGSTRVVGQLTLEVGSAIDDELPIAGVVKIGGSLRVEQDLKKDQQVRVVVLDADSGETLCEAIGEVASVKLTTKRTETTTYVERLHAVAPPAMRIGARVQTPDGPGRVVNVLTFKYWNVAKSRLDPLNTYVVELDDGEPKRRLFAPGQLQIMAVAA